MQVATINRRVISPEEIITDYIAGKLTVRLIGKCGGKMSFEDILFQVACQRIAKQLEQRRDTLVIPGSYGIIKVSK